MRRLVFSNSGSAGVKAVALLLLVILFTVFVLQNTEVVEITFFFWKVSVSRVLLLLGSGLVGGIAGFFFGWSVFGRRPSAVRHEAGEADIGDTSREEGF